MPQQFYRSLDPIVCQSKGKVTSRGSDRALLHHMLWQFYRSLDPIGCQSKGKVTPRGSDRALLHHMLWQMAILEGGVTDLREARNRKMAHGLSLERHCKPQRP